MSTTNGFDSLLGFTMSIWGALTEGKIARRIRWGSGISPAFDEDTEELTINVNGAGGSGIDVSGGENLSGVLEGRTELVFSDQFHVHVNGPTGATIELIESASFSHAPVEAVLLEVPALYTENVLVAPTAEQADGVTLGEGARCLVRWANPGILAGIWTRFGSVLIQAPDNIIPDGATGHMVTVRSGRIYRGCLFHGCYPSSGLFPQEPYWRTSGGPMYAHCKAIPPDGAAGWVEILTFYLAYSSDYTHKIRLTITAKNSASTNAIQTRVFDRSFTLVGDGSYVLPADGVPIVLADPGEPDRDAGVLLAITIHGMVQIFGARAGLNGPTCTYDVRAWVESTRYA